MVDEWTLMKYVHVRNALQK